MRWFRTIGVIDCRRAPNSLVCLVSLFYELLFCSSDTSISTSTTTSSSLASRSSSKVQATAAPTTGRLFPYIGTVTKIRRVENGVVCCKHCIAGLDSNLFFLPANHLGRGFVTTLC